MDVSSGLVEELCMYDALWRHHLLFQDNWWFCFFSWILLLQQFNTGTITAQSIADVFIKLRCRVAFMWQLKIPSTSRFDGRLSSSPMSRLLVCRKLILAQVFSASSCSGVLDGPQRQSLNAIPTSQINGRTGVFTKIRDLV